MLSDCVFKKIDAGMDCDEISVNVQQVLEYIHDNFDRSLSIKDVAEHAGYSYHHLCRKFRAETGVTVLELISRLRIEKAKDLLVTTSEPVGRISRMVGFSSTVQFHRTFAKQTGDSPMQFRKKAFGVD